MTPARYGLGFAGAEVTIEAIGPRPADLVAWAFPQAGLRADENGSRISISEYGDILSVERGDEVTYRGPEAAAAVRSLLELTAAEVIAGSHGGLLLHAGAVCRDGLAVILPGPSGAGKTTLVAGLLAQAHCAYLTDEMTFLAEGRNDIEGLRRPLNVKPGGRHAIAVTNGAWTAAALVGDVASLVQPVAPPPGPTARPGVLVFPRYRAGEGVRIAPVSAAVAAMRLLTSVLNAHHLPDHGVKAAAALARRVPAYELDYGDGDWGVRQVDRLLSEASRRAEAR